MSMFLTRPHRAIPLLLMLSLIPAVGCSDSGKGAAGNPEEQHAALAQNPPELTVKWQRGSIGFTHWPSGDAGYGEMFFQRGQVTDEKLKTLTNLQNLRDLDLAYTEVTDDGLSQFEQLTSLARIDLTGTKITDAGLEYIGRTPSLMELRLTNTRIGDPGLKTLTATAEKLRFVFLDGTDVGDEGLRQLSSMPSLEGVDLRGCRNITSAGVLHLAGLPNLKQLVVSETAVGDEFLSELPKFRQLIFLDVGPNVTEAGRANLASLTELVAVRLSGPGVTDGVLKQLSLPGLQEIRLDSTAVTDDGLSVLYGANDLRRLFLTSSMVTEDGANKLRATLSNCLVRLESSDESE
ncbi:MAG: hypothetical protein R3C19_19575 [Planctomycetaceae bacterium]